MVILENEYLRVTINEMGGSIDSIYDKKRNNEIMYEIDSRSWSSKDIVIFPFVARLKNGTYTVDNKEYSMKNHGIVRYNKLNVWEKSESKCVLYLDSTKETLKEYPYHFHFEVIYTLDHNKLCINYRIVNTDNKPIYYEYGGHPAIKVDGIETNEGFEIKNTILEFESNISVLKNCPQCGASIDDEIECPYCKSKIAISATRCPHCTSELK